MDAVTITETSQNIIVALSPSQQSKSPVLLVVTTEIHYSKRCQVGLLLRKESNRGHDSYLQPTCPGLFCQVLHQRRSTSRGYSKLLEHPFFIRVVTIAGGLGNDPSGYRHWSCHRYHA
jgi:hypothetical protein